nr:MAG TPA: hypothetical protein [Caudoviricetes sp.]
MVGLFLACYICLKVFGKSLLLIISLILNGRIKHLQSISFNCIYW